MNNKKWPNLVFNADFIEKIKFDDEIAVNCRLRSKFVHDKIYQSRTKKEEYSVILYICEKVVKILQSTDQTILSSHSIKHLSYSACDRIHQLFAYVFHSSKIERGHFCFIFRMNTVEQAESINQYFGWIFKQLSNKKREIILKSNINCVEKTEIFDKQLEPISNVPKNWDFDTSESVDEIVDSRLREISSSNINVLALEKHDLRRQSLHMPSTDSEDSKLFKRNQPLHTSLEKNVDAGSKNVIWPFVRQKKAEYKSNRTSALIEKLTFRGSREIIADISKSGSPVVALKEQLESEEKLFSENNFRSKFDPELFHNPNDNHSSNSNKQLVASLSNLQISNASKVKENIVSNLVRKNSAPISTLLKNEQLPVPPVRVHSLLNTSFPNSLKIIQNSQLIRGSGKGDICDDGHRSSNTTSLSCGGGTSELLKYSIYDEPPPPSIKDKDNSGNSCISSHAGSSNVCLQYFRDINKREVMEFLVDKEVGCFVLRNSDSHHGCMALSVKVSEARVSHFIVEHTTEGHRLKGLDRTWPDLLSMITHLSVTPELLPCPLRLTETNREPSNITRPPTSLSAGAEYEERIKRFLNDTSA